MKVFFTAYCLSLLALCGCHSASGLRILGAETAQATECVVPDSRSNRFDVASKVGAVATRFGLQDLTQDARSRKDREPTYSAGFVIISHHSSTNLDAESKGISLSTSVWQGKVVAMLYQARWHATRTSRFEEIRETLVAEFESQFGALAEVRDKSWIRK